MVILAIPETAPQRMMAKDRKKPWGGQWLSGSRPCWTKILMLEWFVQPEFWFLTFSVWTHLCVVTILGYIFIYIHTYIYDKICYTYQRGSIWPMQHHPLPASGSCTWPLPLLTYHFTSGPASVDSPFHGKKRVEKWNFHGNKTPGRNHVMDDGPGFFWQIVPLATQLLNDLNVYYPKSLLWKPWPVWSDGLLLNNRGCSSIPERT